MWSQDLKSQEPQTMIESRKKHYKGKKGWKLDVEVGSQNFSTLGEKCHQFMHRSWDQGFQVCIGHTSGYDALEDHKIHAEVKNWCGKIGFIEDSWETLGEKS